MLAHYLHLAILMLKAKPIRSVLSILGIYTGVLALVVILAIHEGSRQEIENLFRTEGVKLVLVQPGFDEATRRIGRLSLDDAKRILSVNGVQSAMVRYTTDRDVRSANGTMHAKVFGIDEVWTTIFRVPVIAGRLFLKEEVQSRQPICLLTEKSVKRMFPFGHVIGQTIDIQGEALQVVGVVRWDAGVGQRSMLEEPDILLPYPWLARDEKNGFSTMEVRLDTRFTVSEAVALVSRAATRGDPGRQNLFIVQSLEELLQGTRESNQRMLRSLLAIAGVSLLVGAIGVANVMLTSVTERTREIGIRKALGARRSDILLQFLVESCVLCVSGGFLAVGTGMVGIFLLPGFVTMHFQLVAPPLPIIACLALTILIGIFAGLYAASHAASLSPAEALRYE